MGSKTSKAKRPSSARHSNSAETGTIIIPRVPQEIIDEILHHLTTDSRFRTLRSCALVSKSWVPSCRRRLFHTILFTSKDMVRWVETFPVPEESPAHHVRDLRLSIGGRNSVPEKFLEYTPWFTNVEGVSFFQQNRSQPLWIPSFWRFPQSVTSLTINADRVFLSQIQNIMAQLPNLDDVVLSGTLAAVDERTLPGIGTASKGRFCGRLRLIGGNPGGSVAKMLSEIPTGFNFTEVRISGRHSCLPSTERLVEACGRTLVRLSYMIDSYCKCHHFSPLWCTNYRH